MPGGRPSAINTQVIEKLVRYVRDGAYDCVAAEAAGISARTFRRWIARGRLGEEPYGDLERRVRQAHAHARARAERWVHRKQPLSWLRFGPAQSQRGVPGWTDQARDLDDEDEQPDLDPADVEALARALSELTEENDRDL